MQPIKVFKHWEEMLPLAAYYSDMNQGCAAWLGRALKLPNLLFQRSEGVISHWWSSYAAMDQSKPLLQLYQSGGSKFCKLMICCVKKQFIVSGLLLVPINPTRYKYLTLEKNVYINYTMHNLIKLSLCKILSCLLYKRESPKLFCLYLLRKPSGFLLILPALF